MLETSSDLLLIVIAVAVAALTAFLCYLIWSLAKIVLEARKTVSDVNKKLEKIDPMVDSTTETLTELMGTLQTINTNLLRPVASLSKMVKNMRNAFSVFRGGSHTHDHGDEE